MAGDDLVAHHTLRRFSAELLGVPDYVVTAVLAELPDPVTMRAAFGRVWDFWGAHVNTTSELLSAAMAKTESYLLVAGAAPVQIADNDSSRSHTFLISNVDDVNPAELLGPEEVLGDGSPWAAGSQAFFDLGPGETLFAASAFDVELRVLKLG